MSRRSLALGSLLGGSLLALAVAWTNARVGQDLTRALALVALVGTVLILVLRVRGRQVVGLLLGVLGLAMALAAALLAGSAVSWRIAYAIGGALVASGGLLTMITSTRWPARPDRFRRSETGASAGTADPADLWRAMDAGRDPTADPDVRKADPGDTMRSANQSQQSRRK
jgi:drug/metabolite transporter (DMT)-like permease